MAAALAQKQDQWYLPKCEGINGDEIPKHQEYLCKKLLLKCPTNSQCSFISMSLNLFSFDQVIFCWLFMILFIV